MKVDQKKLEIALARKGKSFTEIAKEMKIDVSMISKINKGFDGLRPRTVGKLAKALGVDVTELLED